MANAKDEPKSGLSGIQEFLTDDPHAAEIVHAAMAEFGGMTFPPGALEELIASLKRKSQ